MNSRDYKCPSCGGIVTFDPESGKLKCDACGTLYDPADFADVQEDKLEESADDSRPEEKEAGIVNYICPSCGGEIFTDQNTSAAKCPYCDSPVILADRLDGEWRPDAVIPFEISRQKAKDLLRDFYKDKKLLPNAFSDENHLDDIQGVYVPYWLFDCQADAGFVFSAERTSTWADSRFVYTKHDVYHLHRSASFDFDQIPADASKKMADSIMEAIEPFRYDKLVPFDMNYLAGYLADRYDVDKEEEKGRIQQRIEKSAREELSRDVGAYSSVKVVASDDCAVHYDNIAYALLPVWILNTRYKDQLYTFTINGQTGKIAGKLPSDSSKVTRYSLISFAAAFLVTALIATVIILF